MENKSDTLVSPKDLTVIASGPTQGELEIKHDDESSHAQPVPSTSSVFMLLVQMDYVCNKDVFTLIKWLNNLLNALQGLKHYCPVETWVLKFQVLFVNPPVSDRPFIELKRSTQATGPVR